MQVSLDDGPGGGEGDVQMAPLIDCVFLLLIYFLVTAAMQKIHKELPVDLPVAEAASKAKLLDKDVIIAVSKDGQFHIEAEAVTQQQLHKRLREVSLQKGKQIRIDADRSAAFQYISHVLNELQFYNLKDVGIRVKD